MKNKFTLTEEHIKLLHAMYIRWENCETGAPAVDPKRPYGNSYVPGDVREILGWPETEYGDDEEDEKAYAIHRETEYALQIVLRHGPVLGDYVLKDKYSRTSWVKVDE